MLRKALESRTGHLSNSEFAIVCGITEDDLKANRVNFKRCTSLKYVLDIAVRATKIFRSCL
ncbi:MAG: hypothetical protein ACREV6_19670 [Clostridium sp.]|uniref:hypothetical protein n=1 Tax=Clostridium sp. TaxID=1506 RepID=UPI003D6D725C